MYTGASILVARLSAELTKISYDRHLLFTDRFTECGPFRAPAVKAKQPIKLECSDTHLETRHLCRSPPAAVCIDRDDI